MTQAPPAGPRTRQEQRTLYLALSALLMGMLLAALDQTIVATALPTIVSELGGLDHLSWVVTAYLLAATAGTPLWGKLGDQYGRKKLFQAAITIFLVGSALCGVAQDMAGLIAFRAVQGLGGGGLMVLSMAIVGDLVPPRERGRYQGLFGAVFGASSVLGPLLGGLFVDHLSWRWVFYVNLPLGVLALLVIAAVLHIPVRRDRHRIDYLGTLLIAAVATCVVLGTSLGGTTWEWDSPGVLGLAVLGAALLAWFVRVERRAAEPVLPPALFRVRTFTLCAVISFVIGFAMFGSMTYLPTFLQVVHGITPTLSGVHMLPMVLGILTTSTLSGQLISRTGRWKVYPVLGTAVTVLGLLLLHNLDADSGTWEMSAYFLVFGAGLGLVLQVIVLVVQNAVRYEDLGVATSGATFFRSIGAAVGVSVFGTVFAARLGPRLESALAGERLPPGVTPRTLAEDPRAVAGLEPGQRAAALDAYSISITDVFLWAVPVTAVAFGLACLLRETPLRASVQAPDSSETLGLNPVTRSSREELLRALTVLSSRAGRRDLYAGLVADAGLTLRPATGWLLLRMHRDGHVEPALLADRYGLDRTVIAAGAREAEERRLAEREGLGLSLTPAGHDIAARLAAAREAALAALLGDWWTPERPRDLTVLVRQLSRDLGGGGGETPREEPDRRP
ncbi:MDR family MFS transporter [Streptomyces sp. TRM 70351]|uniref:MDR family MFS transporter n=1 Tax=Streptomyces sp. TRM 70351 TaxID=3116552 RepID=UPI002E7C02E9|nr:MDR family MFS transporter [Streptomyces sp. TRM 70351]MEE1928542.1 MDR family MFS transporter [Streptomyces sp. TRM 70351]